MCCLGRHTRGWEHGFAARIGVRISARHTQTGLSTEPPSYRAFDEKLELKQDTETEGLPSSFDRGQRVAGGLDRWVPLKSLDAPK